MALRWVVRAGITVVRERERGFERPKGDQWKRTTRFSTVPYTTRLARMIHGNPFRFPSLDLVAHRREDDLGLQIDHLDVGLVDGQRQFLAQT